MEGITTAATVIIAIYACTTYLASLKKQKQDLWKLRYSFFVRAYDFWGYRRYNDLRLKINYYPEVIEKQKRQVADGLLPPGLLSHGVESLEIINEEWGKRGDNHVEMQSTHFELLREARFLFGKDFAQSLLDFEGEQIQYWSQAKEMDCHGGMFTEAFNSIFGEPFVVKFDKYLILEDKPKWSWLCSLVSKWSFLLKKILKQGTGHIMKKIGSFK